MESNTSYCYTIPDRQPLSSDVNRLGEASMQKDPTPLTGWVQGQPASDLEERFARALTKAGLPFTFQHRVSLAGSIPGQDKRLDFMVEDGMPAPVEIDGPIAHRTAAQQGADVVREILLNHAFIRRGIRPIRRVKWWQLASQHMANRLVAEMFGGSR